MNYQRISVPIEEAAAIGQIIIDARPDDIGDFEDLVGDYCRDTRAKRERFKATLGELAETMLESGMNGPLMAYIADRRDAHNVPEKLWPNMVADVVCAQFRSLIGTANLRAIEERTIMETVRAALGNRLGSEYVEGTYEWPEPIFAADGSIGWTILDANEPRNTFMEDLQVIFPGDTDVELADLMIQAEAASGTAEDRAALRCVVRQVARRLRGDVAEGTQGILGAVPDAELSYKLRRIATDTGPDGETPEAIALLYHQCASRLREIHQ